MKNQPAPAFRVYREYIGNRLYIVKFSVGCQEFILAQSRTLSEARWFEKQLSGALGRLTEQALTEMLKK